MQNKSDLIGIIFYIFISLLLGIIGISAVITLWVMLQALQASAVALLLLIQIGLFWLNVKQHTERRWWLFYYTAQTSIVVMVTLLLFQSSVNDVTYLGSAVLCLIGETLGIWRNSRTTLLLGLFYFALALLMFRVIIPPERYLMVLASLLLNGGFIVLLMVSFNQQLVERQKAVDLAESLESANAKLAASAARIETLTLQNERQRMARELHDTLAQGLAGLILQLEAAKAHLGTQRPERAARIVEQALTGARSTLAESRAVIDNLRLSSTNLFDSIQNQSERFSQATGMTCQLELMPELEQLPEHISQHCAQIVSEALTNTARHAQASHVTIRCSMRQHSLDLLISDNGKGFDTRQNGSVGHYGLLGMQERARLIGATLGIESSAEGTNVHLRVDHVPREAGVGSSEL